MNPTEFKKWRKNGNFTVSQDRILEVSNHISEGEHSCYTKAEAAQVATYWSLEASDRTMELANFKSEMVNNILALSLKVMESLPQTSDASRDAKEGSTGKEQG